MDQNLIDLKTIVANKVVTSEMHGMCSRFIDADIRPVLRQCYDEPCVGRSHAWREHVIRDAG